jgi:hemerythrin-like domain-containing protein
MPLVNRRVFVGGIAALGTPLWAAPQEEEVSPNEDLMREHGVLVRCLVIYREAMRRIDAKQQIPPAVIPGTAKLIRDFVENYHEKLEEEQLFPRFRKAGRLVELVNVLETQHQKGRGVTDRILESAGRPQELRSYLEMFVRMYEPHEAREDTVLFPGFRKIVSPKEYDALGDQFEEKENKLFGANGFEKNVSRVAELEKALGIYDLAQFTPRV